MSVAQIELPEWCMDGLFDPYRYKVSYGGRGASRSWTFARALLIRAMEKRTRILCARELQASINDSVHRLLADQIEMFGLPFEVVKTEIRHPNGSLFIFKGLRHNANEIRSTEGIDLCWVEDAQAVSAESWKALIPTIRKPGSEIWVTFNPDKEDDPTYVRFVKNKPPRSWVKKVTVADNPWASQELLEERAFDYSVDPDSADHVWGGNIRTQSDAQIFRGKYRVEAFDVEPGWEGPYQGGDFGFAKDPSVLVRVWLAPSLIHKDKDGKPLPGRRLMVEYESWKVGLELDHTVDRWKQDVPGSHKYRTRADSAEAQAISYLRRHGFSRIRGVKKWPGSVEDGIRWIRSLDEVVIHSRCTRTAQEFKLYSYETDKRTGDVLPKIKDAHNHTIDSVRYACAPIINTSRKKRGGAWFPSMDEEPDSLDDDQPEAEETPPWYPNG
jgi:phage terminase large subunit